MSARDRGGYGVDDEEDSDPDPSGFRDELGGDPVEGNDKDENSNPANAPSATGAPGGGFDPSDPRDAPSARGRGMDEIDGGGGSTSSEPANQTDREPQSQRPDTPEPETSPIDIPNVGEIIDERVDAVEQQFLSELQDTQNAFNQQIDSVTGSVSDLQSNVQENFSALGSGLEGTQSAVSQTQQAISSIPGSIASLLQSQQEGGDGSDGLTTGTLVAGAAAVLAVAYAVTQTEG